MAALRLAYRFMTNNKYPQEYLIRPGQTILGGGPRGGLPMSFATNYEAHRRCKVNIEDAIDPTGNSIGYWQKKIFLDSEMGRLAQDICFHHWQEGPPYSFDPYIPPAKKLCFNEREKYWTPCTFVVGLSH